MPSVTCFRCQNGGYTTPGRAPVPSNLDVPNNIVVQEIQLCAKCRADATRENAQAKDRSRQRGENG